MEEELEMILEDVKEKMDKAVSHLEKAFIQIRAGKANPSMLSGVVVEYYGASTPLSQVANVGTPDAMTLSVQPFDKSIIGDIEKAILVANLGLNPSNNGDSIMINIPPLTEERRRELVKQAKSESENAKVGIRAARKDGNQEVKKVDNVPEDVMKDTEAQVQKMTDNFIVKIEEVLALKEKEIMTV